MSGWGLKSMHGLWSRLLSSINLYSILWKNDEELKMRLLKCEVCFWCEIVHVQLSLIISRVSCCEFYSESYFVSYLMSWCALLFANLGGRLLNGGISWVNGHRSRGKTLWYLLCRIFGRSWSEARSKIHAQSSHPWGFFLNLEFMLLMWDCARPGVFGHILSVSCPRLLPWILFTFWLRFLVDNIHGVHCYLARLLDGRYSMD